MENSWFKKALEKSDIKVECLVFNGAKVKKGYGVIWDNGRLKYLHRLSYEKYKGEIPEGLIVRHTCDNPSCWNPEHLSVGSNKDNMQDMVDRGRSPKGSKNSNSKLTESDVLKIKTLLKNCDTQKEIAKMFSVSVATISDIKKNKRWPHITLDTL